MEPINSIVPYFLVWIKEIPSAMKLIAEEFKEKPLKKTQNRLSSKLTDEDYAEAINQHLCPLSAGAEVTTT